jgi:hypothetical protein
MLPSDCYFSNCLFTHCLFFPRIKVFVLFAEIISAFTDIEITISRSNHFKRLIFKIFTRLPLSHYQRLSHSQSLSHYISPPPPSLTFSPFLSLPFFLSVLILSRLASILILFYFLNISIYSSLSFFFPSPLSLSLIRTHFSYSQHLSFSLCICISFLSRPLSHSPFSNFTNTFFSFSSLYCSFLLFLFLSQSLSPFSLISLFILFAPFCCQAHYNRKINLNCFN